MSQPVITRLGQTGPNGMMRYLSDAKVLRDGSVAVTMDPEMGTSDCHL